MNRREYLTTTGLTLLSGCSTPFGDVSSPIGPFDSENWKLAFEDTFESSSLDTSSWGIGWGWGRNTSMSPTSITPRNVEIQDGKLRIRGTHDEGDILSGAIHSKNKVTFGPGSYLEARIKFARREGFQNAFWTKPNSEAWPPEIDVVELWQDGTDETHRSHHNIHYSRSGEPGDRSTYDNVGVSHTNAANITNKFKMYGVLWDENRISHYVDGEKISEFDLDPILLATSNGKPFYMMFSLNINNIGTADTSVNWGEAMVVDWVRVWTKT